MFYHLAWSATSHEGRKEVRPHIDNITYSLDAVELAKRMECKRFIGAGSQAEYGRHNEKLSSNTLCIPDGAYGAAKLCSGNMSRIRCHQLGMGHVWTRILSAYGPYDNENTIIALVIKALLRGERFQCTKCEQMWEFIYSKDVADAFLLIGEKGIDGKTYSIGTGEGRPLWEFIEMIKDTIDHDAVIGYGDIPYGEQQIMHLEADISELYEDTGFIPRTSFRDGIDETIQYFKKRLKG